MTEDMNERIDLPREVRGIIEVLEAQGFEAYAVGGAVRDMCIGVSPGDFDITTSALPEEVKALFPRTVDTGIAHGTVTVLQKGTGYEVTTYRIDGKYSDARHPESVEFTRSLREDLRRRDFTVNAMAYNPRTGLVDLFGGREDLENRLIRAVGDPAARFQEDALRIMHCVRFAAQLDIDIEEGTLAAAARLFGNLKLISRERIREELFRLLLSDHPERVRTLWEIGGHTVWSGMARSGVRSAVLPAPQDAEISRLVRILQGTEKERILRLAAFFCGLAQASAPGETCAALAEDVLTELKSDNETRDAVVKLCALSRTDTALTKTGVRRLIAEAGYPQFDRLMALLKAELLADGKDTEVLEPLTAYRNEIEAAGECVRMKDMKLGGSDLIRMGMKPGKAMGALLAQLFSEVLETPELNTPEALSARAETLMKAPSGRE